MQQGDILRHGVQEAPWSKRLQYGKQQPRRQTHQQVARQGPHQHIPANQSLLREVANQALTAPGHQQRPDKQQREARLVGIGTGEVPTHRGRKGQQRQQAIDPGALQRPSA